jgi:hypothetical protein
MSDAAWWDEAIARWAKRNGVIDLAKRHGIPDLAVAMAKAESCYHSVCDDPSKTLDEVERLSGPLLDLLFDEVNRQRLIGLLADDVTDERTVANKFDESRHFLYVMAQLAGGGYQKRGRGTPRQKDDLRGAYNVLVARYGNDRSDFTNVWAETDELVPTSPAAQFLYDSLRLIDPHRTRLAQELRDLMGETVKSLPGPRRGRKRKSG